MCEEALSTKPVSALRSEEEEARADLTRGPGERKRRKKKAAGEAEVRWQDGGGGEQGDW